MKAPRVTRVAVLSAAPELSQPIFPSRGHRVPRRLVDEEMRDHRSRRPASDGAPSASAREPSTTVPNGMSRSSGNRGHA
jgi:hypothetical protein